jgi:hypothetical protein
MTVENNSSFVVKTKRKEHPQAVKYPGRPTMEISSALTKFMCDVGDANVDSMLEGEYVFEEEVTAEFFDSLQIGDVVGLGCTKGLNEIGENPHKMACAYQFKILDIDKDNDTLKARNVTYESRDEKKKSKYQESEVEITFQDVSYAIGMGMADILERDGKFYGVSEEIEMKVNIVNLDEKKTAEENATVSPVENADSSAVEAPTSNSNNNTVESTTEI